MDKSLVREMTKMKPDFSQFSIDDQEIWKLGQTLWVIEYPSEKGLAEIKKIVHRAFDGKITTRSLNLRSNRFKINFGKLYQSIRKHSGVGIWKVQNSKWSSKFTGFVYAHGVDEAKRLSQMLYPEAVTSLVDNIGLYDYLVNYTLVELTTDSNKLKEWQTAEINSIKKEIDQNKTLINSCSKKVKKLLSREELLKNVINIFKN